MPLGRVDLGIPGFENSAHKTTCPMSVCTGAVYKKHYPPSLDDEVWRLEGLGKDGAFHQRLENANLKTVEELLRLFVLDPRKLRKVRIPTLARSW